MVSAQKPTAVTHSMLGNALNSLVIARMIFFYCFLNELKAECHQRVI